MSRVVRFHDYGDADVLRIDEIPPEAPGPGEVRIRVEAFALNRSEVMLRQNLYFEHPEPPSRLGYDAAGVVEAVGAEVSGVEVGDRVNTLPTHSQSKYGVYGDWAIVPGGCLMKYPGNLSAEEAATIGVQYMTGYFALFELGALQAGQHVLITAASSSTGVAAIQLAKAAGVRTIATSRTSAKKDALLALGADHFVATGEEDLAQRVQTVTDGRGVAVAFDPIGGATVGPLVESIGMGGKVVLYGLLDMSPPTFTLGSLLAKNASIHGYTVFWYTGYVDWGVPPRTDAVERATQFIVKHLADGSIRPVIAKTFRLDEVVEAQRYMESNAQVGKIVVVTD